MTAIACVPPEILKLILEKKGYKVKRDTKYNGDYPLDTDRLWRYPVCVDE